MSLQTSQPYSMDRRAQQFYSDGVLQSTEAAANRAQAEAVVCDRCGKKVHPANWWKHQKSDHGDDPKPLHDGHDRLPLAAIRTDGGTQPRAMIDTNTVEEYAEAMNSGAKFPAITVFFDGQDYWLADGFHRLNAALKLHWLDLPAEVRQGTQRDAILFSAGVNATHGLRRTNSDKRRAVERLLRDEEWSKWSNREIARQCVVSEHLVRSLRPSRSDQPTYTTKHGTQATMHTGNIGKGQPPVTRPPGTAPDMNKVTDQANQLFGQKPAPVTYGRREDDGYQDDVPSKNVYADESDYFYAGDKVNSIHGRTGGLITATDYQRPDCRWVCVQYPQDEAFWTNPSNLRLVERGNGQTVEPTPADVRAAVIEQIRSDLDQVQDADARERLAAIVTRHEREQEDRAQRKAAWQEHENRRLLAAQTPPPEGQYRTIVVDPPWPMKRIEREVRPNQREYLDYPTMRLRDIKALDVQSLAAEDGCHLYLWTTHKFLPDALEITKEWGFRYNCLLTWEKNTGMTPYHFRFNTELVIFATRGSMAVQRKGLPLCFRGEAGGHSTKPDTFFDMVRQASPGPRLEMFARREREGFTVWGNEVTHAAAAAG